MKFDRYPHRQEPFEWTKRKLLAFNRKPERKLAAAQAAYPLLADLMELPAVLSPDAERARREALDRKAVQSWRNLAARHWRNARANYFAASPSVQAAIRCAWEQWRGARKATYFSYIVDRETGALALRVLAAAKHTEEIRQKVLKELGAQETAQARLF